jgi:hypothetical protein
MEGKEVQIHHESSVVAPGDLVMSTLAKNRFQSK